jgi:hypothetical protein
VPSDNNTIFLPIISPIAAGPDQSLRPAAPVAIPDNIKMGLTFQLPGSSGIKGKSLYQMAMEIGLHDMAQA